MKKYVRYVSYGEVDGFGPVRRNLEQAEQDIMFGYENDRQVYRVDENGHMYLVYYQGDAHEYPIENFRLEKWSSNKRGEKLVLPEGLQ